MALLTSAHLTALKRVVAQTSPDTAQVQRKTTTSDGQGGQIESWATVATVACRVAPAGTSPDERVIAEQLQATVTWTLTLPAGTDVRASDRILVGSRTFEIVAPLARRSFEVRTRVVCREIG